MMTTTTRSSRTTPVGAGRPARDRRGVAMMLVMIALGSATVMTGAYLSSRDNSSEIAGNAGASSRAQWASRATGEMAVALLETTADWRAAASDDGALFSNFEFAGAQVSVLVTDLEGNPPTGAEPEVLVTTVARAGNISKASQKLVRVQKDVAPDTAIDPEMREFAVNCRVFDIDPSSTLGIWRRSPMSDSSIPARVCVRSSASIDVDIAAESTMTNAALFVPPTASSGLKSIAQGTRFVEGVMLPLNVPVFSAAPPAALTGLPTRSVLDTVLVGIASTITPGEHQSLIAYNGGVATLNAGDYSFNHFTAGNNGVLRIVGDVRILVRGSVGIVSGGAIELADDSSSLTMYVCNALDVDNGGIGVPRTVARNSSRSPEALTAYIDPSRVRILGVRPENGGQSYPDYRIDNRGMVVAIIHAPNADMRLDTDGMLFGRATMDEFRLDDGSLFYDPALDGGVGFANLEGPLYDGSKQPVNGLVTALSTFDAATGLDALDDWCRSKLPAFTAPPPPTKGVVADRKAERAEGRTWPMRAKAMELRIGAGGGGAENDGGASFLKGALGGLDNVLASTTEPVNGAADDVGFSTK